MAQFARPISDLFTGSWTTTPLWSKIDEGAPGDATVIQSDDNTSPDTCVVNLNSITDPGISTGHVLRVRWRKSASGGHQVNAGIALIDGGINRAGFSTINIGSTFQTDTFTLSSGQANSIANYGSLQIRLQRTGDTGGNPNGRRPLIVDFVELEVPNAATQVNGSLTGPSVTLSSDASVLTNSSSSLTGPTPTLASSSSLLIQADSSFTGPLPTVAGSVSASVGRTASAALTGPSASLSSSLKALLDVSSNLTGPVPNLSSTLSNAIGINGNLTGVLPTIASSVKALLKVNSSNTGPAPSLSAILDNSVNGGGPPINLPSWRGRGRVCAARRMQPGFMGTKFR